MSIYIKQDSIEEGINNSRIKQNREYLLSTETAKDFNTYFSFDIFPTFSDLTTEEAKFNAIKELNGADGPLKYPVGTWGARSIFNKFGAILVGGPQNNKKDSPDVLEASEIKISQNAPLIDTPTNRAKMRDISRNCTIRDLVEDSKKGILGRAIYSYSDFMYCKHLGKMPNNYLITLRRFPTPPDDYISNAGYRQTRMSEPSSKTGTVSSSIPLPMGQLVTWLNTPGNNLEDILKYDVSMPYQEKTAQWESRNINADSNQTPLNALASMFDKTYRQQYQEGYAGSAINGYVNKFFPLAGDPPYSDMFGFKDNNKIYGPVDAIKKVYMRSEDGIDFNQSFTLTFDYELRSYNGINGKAAMLDLIANILNVVYTTGDWWGGAYYGGGAHQNDLFANLNIMKTSGGFSNFVDAFMADSSNIKKEISNSIQNNGGGLNGALSIIKGFLNDLGGMLVGGMLNKLGRPQKAMMNSLLSGAATGLWHVTIGNPYHPIMSIGNMVLTKTSISHYGPLGLDDFPTGIKVVCELTRGKPRDSRGIEMLYMNGNDRIYTSMGPMVFELYQHARQYKQNNFTTDSPEINTALFSGKYMLDQDGKTVKVKNSDIQGHVGRNRVTNDEDAFISANTKSLSIDSMTLSQDIKDMMGDGAIKTKEIPEDGTVNNIPTKADIEASKAIQQKIVSQLGASVNTLQAFFGTKDVYSIYTAASEQEFGAKKKPTLPASENGIIPNGKK